MKHFSSTFTHKGHLEMTYNERKEIDKIEQEAQRKKEELLGITPRVKALKTKVRRVHDASISAQYNQEHGEYVYPYETKQSRHRDRLEKIRQDLMKDPSIYFGDCDHRIVRNSLELESLNSRQRKHLDRAYPWMVTEAQANSKELPEEEWYFPLIEEYEALTDREKENITVQERATVHFFEQRKGHNWLDTPSPLEKYGYA